MYVTDSKWVENMKTHRENKNTTFFNISQRAQSNFTKYDTQFNTKPLAQTFREKDSNHAAIKQLKRIKKITKRFDSREADYRFH